MLNKPKGYLTTRSDERKRKIVYDLLPAWALQDGWMHAGRLDLDTTGILLFSQDGDILESLMHPGSVDKEYRLEIRGHVQEHHVKTLLAGVHTPIGVLAAKEVIVKKVGSGKSHATVILDEGRNLHIRRMFAELKDDRHNTVLRVLNLRRTRIGAVSCDVPLGSWRWLTLDEADSLL